jgi:prephenate dehydrogenase
MNDASFPFKSILVVGLGLIGGSILKDLKELKAVNKVFGVDLDEKIVSKAFELNLIRNKDNNLDKMEEDALVIFSVPSLSFEAAYNSLHNLLPDEKVTLTDTMSSKGNLIDFLRSNKQIQGDFIFSHPIAGSEKSGLSNSLPSLFKNKLVVVSPFKNSNKDSLVKLNTFWAKLGSKVSILDFEIHDKIFSNTSHLPHILSFALMDYLEKKLSKEVFKYSGGSLEDYTRIASSDPVMWRDILLSNKTELLNSIEGFRSSLNEMYDLIESGDRKSILEFLNLTKSSRDKLLDKEV